MYSCTLTFQTLLGSFVQRTSAKQPLSFSSPPFPLFCECKDTAFSFPSNTFLNFFQLFFIYFSSHWFPLYYNNKYRAFLKNFTRISRSFRPFSPLYGHFYHQKYHKIEKITEKPMRKRRSLMTGIRRKYIQKPLPFTTKISRNGTHPSWLDRQTARISTNLLPHPRFSWIQTEKTDSTT